MLIVTGYDGSPQSGRAAARADELATALSAEHHVVMVVHLSPAEYSTVMNPYVADLGSHEEQRLTTGFEEVSRKLRTPVKSVLIHGNPVLELTAYARQREADLIVVGSRGRAAVATVLLGSVSHGVLWHADRDVLVVR